MSGPNNPERENASERPAGVRHGDAANSGAGPHPKGRSGTSLDASLEAEISKALGHLSIEDLLDEPQPKRPGARDTRRGLIVSIREGEVLIEFGPKTQGVCPLEQFPSMPEPGTEDEFILERFNRSESIYVVRRIGAISRAEWSSLSPGQVVEARCTGVNKGGLDMEVDGHRAFMPAGQADLHHVEDLTTFVGKTLACEVLEADQTRNRIVLSRKAMLQAERSRQREETLQTLEVGQTVEAVITTVQPYGAFADIGGVDGLIHISDLSWERTADPSRVVSPGDRVRVRVLKIDTEQSPPRIGLGLKQTLEDPFTRSSGSLEPGTSVTGRVTRIAQFGAFVEIEPGVEGLIHISELSRDRVQHVSSILKPDQIVTAEVISVDPDQRRIALSLKAAAVRQEEDAPDRASDPALARQMAKLANRFGSDLRGGLG